MEVIIVAAGKSSRFYPLSINRHKSTIKVCGKPIIYWTIKSLEVIGVKRVIIVQSVRRDVEECLKNLKEDLRMEIDFVIQEKPLGTGHAISLTKDLITTDKFIVINPNHINVDYFFKKYIAKKLKESSGILLGQKTNQPWNYGVFMFDSSGKPIGLVEKPEKGKEPSDIKIVGIYCLPVEFFKYHDKVELTEYSLEAAIDLMLKEMDIDVVIINEKDRYPSLKYPWQLYDMFIEIIKKFFKKSYISSEANISEKAEIDGIVYIDEGVNIREFSVIKGPCYIGKNSQIGNFTLIRQSHMGEKCMIGCFTEIARSIFLENIHIHSGYVGDSIVGSNTRIGANFVTANRRLDRKTIKVKVKEKTIDSNKDRLGTIIGENVKIGINVSVMPGKIIGNNCIVGPNTPIYENIKDNTKIYLKVCDGNILRIFKESC